MKASESERTSHTLPAFILYVSAFKTNARCHSLVNADAHEFIGREEKHVFSFYGVELAVADDDVNASLMNK